MDDYCLMSTISVCLLTIGIPTIKPTIMNTYIRAGLIATLVSFIIHYAIATTVGISFSEIFPLYFVAGFITLTGVGYHFEEKHKETGKTKIQSF